MKPEESGLAVKEPPSTTEALPLEPETDTGAQATPKPAAEQVSIPIIQPEALSLEDEPVAVSVRTAAAASDGDGSAEPEHTLPEADDMPEVLAEGRPPSEPDQGKRFTLLRYDRRALGITCLTLLAMLLIGCGTWLLAAKGNSGANPGTKAQNYSVGSNLDLSGLKSGEQLQIGAATQLTVNGRLRVSNTLILTPSSAPSSPTAGQMYYDKATNALYYYNGTRFVSLAPKSGVTALGGTTGAIDLGSGLSLVGNQLSLSASVLQQLANAGGPGVASLQGQTGDVTLSAGQGIAVNGTTISNSGVLGLASGSSNLVISSDGHGHYTVSSIGGSGVSSITGTPNQVNASSSSGNVVLSLPQSIAVTSSPTFAGLTVTGTATAANLNATSAIQINGTQIASSNLSDGSNLAKLNGTGPQTFTGNNEFTGTVLTQLTSPAAFQVQNGTGTSNLFVADTSTNRIGIGTAGPGYKLDVQGGDINTSGIYRVNGAQISSAELSNDSNLAKLNGTNVFSGTNTFSNGVTIQASNSLTLGSGSNAGSIILRDGSSPYTATLQIAGVLSGDGTFNLPVATGTQNICTVESGNCAGSGTGIVGSGTPGKLARFTTNGQTIGDSSISDDGTVVTVATGQIIQGASGLTIGASGVDGKLVLTNSSNGNTLTLQSGVTTGNLTLTLPTADGSDGQCLKTNGGGVLTFAACTGGAGGGVTSINALTDVVHVVGTANQVSVSTAGDTITLALPQDINTGGNATFRTVTLDGATAADNLIVANAVSGATGNLIDLQVNGVSKFIVDPSGNVNAAGEYEINGTQIASSNLSDGSNLAKLNGTGPQTFTGNNEFTGTALFQNASDSTAAFQIQNHAGTSNLFDADTTNSRIGIGTAAPGYTLDVNGDVNTSGVYRVNGVAVCASTGCTAAGGSGDYIQNGTAPQSADFNITGSGTVGSFTDNGSALFQNASDSTAAFQIQNHTGTSNLLVADTTNGMIGIGVQPTLGAGLLQVSGTAAAAGYLEANAGTTAQVTIGSNCTATNSAICFGNGINLYDYNNGVALKTDGEFAAHDLYSTGSLQFGTFGEVPFTTPLNASVDTKIDIPLFDPGNYSQLIALGLPDGASTTARAITVFDARSTTNNQPPLAVVSPDEKDIFGLAWDGANTTGYLKVSTGESGSGYLGFKSDNTTLLTLSPTGDATLTGDLQVQGGDITTNQTTVALLNTTATTINFGGAAATLNIGPGSNTAASINLAGGSSASGCTVDGATGNLACSGAIATTATTGIQGWFTRSGTTLSPTNAGDAITTSGNISTSGSGTITSAGLLTGSAGAAITGTTNINTTGTATTTIGSSTAGAIALSSGSSGVSITSASSTALKVTDGTTNYFNIDTAAGLGNGAFNLGNTSGGPYVQGTCGVPVCKIHIGDGVGDTINLDSATGSSIDVGTGTLSLTSSNVSIAQTGYLNVSGGYEINGVNINTGGTLSNIAYLNQANTFTQSQAINNSSATALQVQDGSGGSVFTVDSSNAAARAVLGGANKGDSILQFQRSGTNTYSIGSDSNSLGGADSLFIYNNTDSQYVAAFRNNGAVAFQNSTDSATAFQIQKAGTGGTLFNVDTSGNGVSIGATGASTNASTVHIADQSNGSGTQTVSIGSTNGSSTTLIQGGSPGAGASISLVAGSGPIQIGANATAHEVDINNTAGASKTVISSGTGGINLNPSGTSNTGVTVQPGTDSTAAFQIQKAGAGGTLFNADTQNSIVSVTAGTDSSTLGSTLFTGSLSGTGWTTSGTGASATATHTTGTTAVGPSPALSLSSGNRYFVNWTITNPNPGSTLTLTMGGQTLATYSFDSLTGGTYSFSDANTIIASSGANLQITPSSSFTGEVSGITVQLMTYNSSPALAVNDTSGAASVEVRASSDNGTLFMGYNAGTQNNPNDGAYGNTGIGSWALQYNVNGARNTAIGTGALEANSSGDDNVALGYNALQSNTSGFSNVAIGNGALQSEVWGASNIAIGDSALASTVAGYDNVGIGHNALTSVTSNYGLVAIGSGSGESLTTGGGNTAVGYGTLRDDVTGYNNTAIGQFALVHTTANENAALGEGVLQADTTGAQNTGIGTYSLGANISGNSNAALGYSAGGSLTSGDDNLFLGDGAGYNLTSGTGNIIIGTVNAPSATGSNQLDIGNAIYGDLSTGSIKLQNSTNTSTAFQILQATTNASLFTADTSGMNIVMQSGYSGETSAWASTVSTGLPAREGNSVVTADGYIYMIAGYNSGAQSDVYYAKLNANGTTGSWTATTSMPSVLDGNRATFSNGYIYVFSGQGGTGARNVYYAKPNADGTISSWTTLSTVLPSAQRDTAAPAANNGYIYWIGGDNGTATSAVSYAKQNPDGSLGTFTTTSSLPAPRTGIQAVVSNGYVYIFGGYDDTGAAQSTVYKAQINANGTLGTWSGTGLASLPNARHQYTAALVNGYVYIMGGIQASNVNGSATNTVYYAHINSDGTISSWNTSSHTLPDSLRWVYGATANGYLYTVNGDDGSPTAAVYYTSVSRVQVAGSLDLVGINGGNLANPGSGGSLTAGDTTIAGSLQVSGQANFSQGVNINGIVSIGAGASNATLANSQAALFVGTNGTRSINASGTINASGADYSEYIPWSGPVPDPGTIVEYNGSAFVVSSQKTAAFVGNDVLGGQENIMVAFAGQVPTKVTGTVNTGDILVDNGDGTARAVSPSQATVADYLGKLGIAEESSSSAGVKLITAAIGTTGANVTANPQQVSSNFSDINVSGTATIDNLTVSGTATLADANVGTLTVTGTATVSTLHVLGDVKFDGSTVTFSSNVRGINLPVSDGASSVTVKFATPHPDADYAVQCTPSYNTTCYVTSKTADSFTINFGTPPADDKQTVDWFVVR